MSAFIRSVQATAAGVWLGGMILIAIVAQTTFSQMRDAQVEHPNAIAGRVMAKNFVRFEMVQWVCVSVLAFGQVARMGMGWRGKGEIARLAMIGVAAAIFIYGATVLTPKIVNLQSSVAGADPEAAVKAAFDAFHETSVRLSKINLGVVLVLALSLAWPSRRPVLNGGGSASTSGAGTGERTG